MISRKGLREFSQSVYVVNPHLLEDSQLVDIPAIVGNIYVCTYRRSMISAIFMHMPHICHIYIIRQQAVTINPEYLVAAAETRIEPSLLYFPNALCDYRCQRN